MKRTKKHTKKPTNNNDALKHLLQKDKIGQWQGIDKKGHFKSDFLKRLVSFSNDELIEKSSRILKAWFAKGKKSNIDLFWKMNACYHECLRREIHIRFQKEYEKTIEKYEKL